MYRVCLSLYGELIEMKKEAKGSQETILAILKKNEKEDNGIVLAWKMTLSL